MKCILCKTEGVEIANTPFMVFQCQTCTTHFSSFTEPASYEKYEELYPGMKEWCRNLKENPNVWRKAADRGFPYAKVIEYFMNQDQKAHILDVGSGWGYMDYILRSFGFNMIGIDVSEEAVNFANETFGYFYEVNTIERITQKFDVVLSIEVFEHVANPLEWMKTCLTVAPKVMITTPNLSSYNSNWVSEDPPVHMACYRKESLQWLAEELGVTVEIDDSGPNIIATFIHG